MIFWRRPTPQLPMNNHPHPLPGKHCSVSTIHESWATASIKISFELFIGGESARYSWRIVPPFCLYISVSAKSLSDISSYFHNHFPISLSRSFFTAETASSVYEPLNEYYLLLSLMFPACFVRSESRDIKQILASHRSRPRRPLNERRANGT